MKLTQARSRQTREQILDAARLLFDKQGSEATSIEMIASAANVAKASVFAHFGDKQNLIAAIGIKAVADLLDASRQAIEAGSSLPLAEALIAVYQPWLAYFGANPDFARLYLSQSALAQGPWTQAFTDSCFGLEDLVTGVITSRLPNKPGSDTNYATMLSKGAQALFHEAVVYRVAGWSLDDAASQAQLRDFLAVWERGALAI
ncbi:MAG: TetR/AcrR family transcriptional regulator [Hoeflea sp.]|uniref:TetR/AcrR family transcriptional regulator n=1 Tax=Hoeflea sp. TaxID=1940281 RepID=UPI003EF7D91D